jgi:hypothetical protein
MDFIRYLPSPSVSKQRLCETADPSRFAATAAAAFVPNRVVCIPQNVMDRGEGGEKGPLRGRRISNDDAMLIKPWRECFVLSNTGGEGLD